MSDKSTKSIIADTTAKTAAMHKKFAANVKSVAYPKSIKDKTGWKLRPENKGK